MRGTYKAALATFAMFTAVGCVGLVNTFRWYSSLPADMAAASLPVSFHLASAKLAVQFLASSVAAGFMLLGSPRAARTAAILAIAALLLVHLSGWPAAHRSALVSDTLFLVHGVRLAIASWLMFVLIGLASNSSLNPKPLRGSA